MTDRANKQKTDKMIRLLFISIFIIQTLITFGQEEVIIKLDKDKTQKSNIFFQADTMPDLICDFEGDYMTKIKTFIGQNLKWPNSEIDCEGTIYIQFIVETDSTMSNTKIIRGLDSCDGFNDEALRVIKLMTKWSPGIKEGQNVRVQLTVPVKFKME